MPTDPTARYEGWWDYLFGEPTRHAAQPHSRGALLGARYQDMPESRHIEDLRLVPEDYAANMRAAYGSPRNEYGDPIQNPYAPSDIGGEKGFVGGLHPANETTADLAFAPVDEDEVYSSSFQPNWRPSVPRHAPYRPSEYGPNLPRPPAYDPALFQDITPGQPGWRTPPSPSGPHPHAYPAGKGPQPPIFGDPGGGIIGAYDVEPVDHDPFGSMEASPNDYAVEPVDHDPFQSGEWTGGRVGRYRFRAGGGIALNEELRRRLAMLSQPRHGFQAGGAPDDPEQPPQDPFMANAQARAQQESEAEKWRQANAPPEPQEPTEPTTWYGRWGKTLDDELTAGGQALGQAQDWLGDKFEHGVGATAAAIGVPSAAGLARDARAAVFEAGELGPRAEPHPNVARYNHPAFPEGRIATRVPTSVALADQSHLSNDAKIGLDTMQTDPKFFDKTAAKAREMPYEPGPEVNGKPTWTPTAGLNIPANATADQVHEHLVNHFTSNILALHDAVDQDIMPGSQKWYEGANARAIKLAQLYKRPLENIAGAFAAMSPKMDWFQNVSLSERLMDIVHNQGDTAFTPEMQNWVTRRYGKAASPADLRAKARFDRIGSSTFNQLTDPLDKAHWVRAYDEAHNSRDYNIVNPDGTFSGPAFNKDGITKARVAWGNGYDPIAKAIRAFTAQDMPSISSAMGDAHKVRSFYNNIIAPWSDHGDVTVDTHAIAAALLRPLAGEDKDVSVGLGMGGPDHAPTGAHGLYGAYVEAYRKAAEARGILPRQMQSITWEALRGLWNPEEKASEAINANVRNVWRRFKNGEIDQPTAQRLLLFNPETGESLIKPPDWHTAGWRP